MHSFHGSSVPPQILEHAPIEIWRVDRDLNLTYLRGRAVGAALDGSLDAYLGRPLSDILDEESKWVLERHRQALSGEPQTYQISWREQTFLVHLDPAPAAPAAPASAASAPAVTGIAIDVTDLLREYQRAKDLETCRARVPLGSDALTHAVLETVRTPLLVLDSKARVLRVNPAFSECFGTSSEATMGRSLFEIESGLWNLPELRARLEGVLSDTGQFRALEGSVSLPGGDQRKVLFDARHVRLEGEEVSLILLSAEDVTEQHRYEKRIEAYSRELERSNRELESFAHAASHDLQEPLRKIRSYVDRLQTSLEPETLDERSARYLARMPEAVERMQTRINDLLQLARVSRNAPVRERVDLGSVVGAVLEDLEVALKESEAQVEVGELPTFEVDASQMRLLFQNLISNAIKFARQGAPPHIRISSERLGHAQGSDSEIGDGAFRIVVEDEGIGFEEQYAERIFEPFQRLHGRTEFEGSGVGLAICQRIVDAHHGAIKAEGRLGTGARFIITLPATSPPEVRP